MKTVYLDYNATTPIAKEVADAMKPYIDDYFGNPSSVHQFGVQAKLAVEKARQQISNLIACDPSEVVFTSGGTESNNYALKGVALANKHLGNHIITSSIEHPAVFEVCEYLSRQGFEITYVDVDEYGIVSADDIKRAITYKTILISIMHANNEVGSIQPIKEISKIARERNIIFHTDAAQSLGKIVVDVNEMGVDLISIAGHKVYAPKGIGALYIRNGVKLEKLMHGADHEQNLRAGTENVMQIVGLGKACELAKLGLEENIISYKNCRDLLFNILQKEFPNMKMNGHAEKRLSNTLSVSFPNVEANTVISRLETVAASAGAACHSESIDVSAVLQAMKIPVDIAMGTIRFSTGRSTTLEDIEFSAKEIVNVVKQLMPSESNKEIVEKDEKTYKLTQYTHGLGCACKINPKNLEQILKKIDVLPDKAVLVGTETSDDASVYLINDDQAIVQTLDFFTPIVDDAYDFGAIAAANALSDIYAMGAKPLFALNIVGFPEETIPLEVLQRILQGARDKAAEAGIAILGGHTIEDPEPKYGMVVSGIIHPKDIIKNTGAEEGDQLVLTKPLGIGILSTALKRGFLNDDDRIALTKVMSSLNKTAAELMLKYDVHACTDVTGFGLMGHLMEMTKGSKMDVSINFDVLPFMSKASDMTVAGIIPGGSFNNLDFVNEFVNFGKLSRTQKLLICDAQTSGGLLVALNSKEASLYLEELHDNGITEACIIGKFTSKGKGLINIE